MTSRISHFNIVSDIKSLCVFKAYGNLISLTRSSLEIVLCLHFNFLFQSDYISRPRSLFGTCSCLVSLCHVPLVVPVPSAFSRDLCSCCSMCCCCIHGFSATASSWFSFLLLNLCMFTALLPYLHVYMEPCSEFHKVRIGSPLPLQRGLTAMMVGTRRIFMSTRGYGLETVEE